MVDKTLSKKIEELKRQKLKSNKLVRLDEYKKLSGAPKHYTVLVVDDDSTMRQGLKRMLESEGLRVFTAEDGLELSKILENLAMDLVLLDVNLPWVDGFEICRLIKSHHTLRKVPLIIISARKDEKDIERGMAAGADEYITKPFDIDQILKLIEKRLEEKTLSI